VADTGIGIPKAKQESVFRAFEQEDTSTTRKYGGTGLGLTIASRLVALMCGKITVQSEPGRGSTFAFTACFGRQSQEREPPTAPPPVVLRDLPVLIVDDNATNRRILEEWLRAWEMRPAAAGDGLAALDALWHGAACGHPYPLVLLDSRMPDVDGLALAAQIRQRGELSAAQIILLTSGERPGDFARCRDLRIDAHLLKPVQQDELLQAINLVMSRTAKDEETRRQADRVTDRTPSSISSPGLLVSPSPSSATSKHLQILIAEDNEFNAQLLEQLLVRRGHRVQVAGNGREALARAAEGGFDLMFLDVHMPELDGFQVIQAIRERERLEGGHLPVVALTARARKEERDRCLAAGMDDFLAKPIQAANLWAAIDGVSAANSSRSPEGAAPADASRSTGRELLDPRVLLAACGDDAAILKNICQAFRAALPDHLGAVQDALRVGDAPRLREVAHKLCGMLAAFSTVAGAQASELEELAARDELAAAGRLFEQLEAMAPRLLRAVDELSLETLRQQTVMTT
jgi:two-component system, sensor histidine kinase and response regulator